MRDKFPVTEQLKLGETLAEAILAILVLCNHARRIGRDKQKCKEACSRLVNFQVDKSETIRSMLAGDATTPEKAKKKKDEKQAAPSPASSHGVAAALAEFTIPPTQEEASSEEADSKATGSWAVRIVGGKQFLQVKSKKGSQESKKLAEHLKKKLEEGRDLGKAKAWKAQQLAKD